jgi:HK97 family phage major capsid protein
MDIKEFEGVLEEATKGLKTDLADAKEKAADALNKYEEIKAELEKSASKEKLEAMEMRVKALQDMADTMAVKLQNRGGSNPVEVKTVWTDLKEQFEAKKADLETFVKAKNGSITLSLKNNISGLAIFGDRVIFGLREPGIDKVQFRERFIFNLIQTIQGGPGSNPLSWVEQRQVTSGEGVATEAGWIAESASKPVMKWEWVENKVTAEFLAAAAIVTKQAILNWPLLQSEIQNELMRELYDVLDNNVINGDGTSNTILGVKSYAKDFNVGSIESISDPQNYDVIRAAIAQVKRGGAPTDRKRGGFNPNYVLVSVDKAAEMDLAKSDTDGHYLMPPFTSADGTVIKGVRVIETNFVDGDEFIVGDFSRYLFNIVDGLSIEIGYINEQFIKNQFTIRAEMYGMGRVKANEAFAFVKGTFTAAKAALLAGPAT